MISLLGILFVSAMEWDESRSGSNLGLDSHPEKAPSRIQTSSKNQPLHGDTDEQDDTDERDDADKEGVNEDENEYGTPYACFVPPWAGRTKEPSVAPPLSVEQIMDSQMVKKFRKDLDMISAGISHGDGTEDSHTLQMRQRVKSQLAGIRKRLGTDLISGLQALLSTAGTMTPTLWDKVLLVWLTFCRVDHYVMHDKMTQGVFVSISAPFYELLQKMQECSELSQMPIRICYTVLVGCLSGISVLLDSASALTPAHTK